MKTCFVTWNRTWGVNCTVVKDAIIMQIKKWTSADNCKDGGEKCLYMLKEVTDNQIKATHTTPKHHYVDDLTFTFKSNASEFCNVEGYSTSETWYAVLDAGTNYCNLHNLITGKMLLQAREAAELVLTSLQNTVKQQVIAYAHSIHQETVGNIENEEKHEVVDWLQTPCL
ncbi:hypothetical protein P5673_030927 [Acropora cervicornis]|uniref:Uncharacterized protein n=1 Tax=Acropora cervicornis TaxID=6130 RepID=A0AAD9PTQ8_ACRCE|nr:hypothetical protein P5673_030927 [Acropora cervicornis]